MGNVGRRVRRSALAVLTGTALAALLAVTTAAAAPVVARPDNAAAARTDVYIRDVTADVGVQPHSLNPLWASPDIKVCPTAVECAVSQNPIVGVTNYIFVKLRNPGPYGTGTSGGVLRVYRTTPGGGAVWPMHWTQIGAMNVTAFAGTTTVTIPWTGVPGPGHFCLLARWVSATDPMTFEGPDIGTNTRNNNNIAWRNVDSVRLVAGGPAIVRPFAIGNSLKVETKNDLVFTQPGEPIQRVGGRVVVDLGPTLFERWQAGGKVGTGVREVGKNQVEVVEPAKASLGNLVLKPGERVEFSLTFAAEAASDKEFALDVTQFGPDTSGAERTDLGGVEYLISVGRQ
ncbi:hypothetical protein O7602_09350 [Micromonospora sp. WMMD1128]|uniref:hypothetical protein n=1 Tax=unclassified Micromonospora TaxID=2617518 RepID=UPI00248C1610|nr:MULTISPECIES: hypothetical protein [unclassified Micromonospora]WBB75687.1 hypothetical protein O7602_09350 [Micromonospora sp. WMMD1128]WFE36528.1 hypothetical protein O7613_14380 [Micromonospora sp. WMMD975]